MGGLALCGQCTQALCQVETFGSPPLRVYSPQTCLLSLLTFACQREKKLLQFSLPSSGDHDVILSISHRQHLCLVFKASHSARFVALITVYQSQGLICAPAHTHPVSHFTWLQWNECSVWINKENLQFNTSSIFHIKIVLCLVRDNSPQVVIWPFASVKQFQTSTEAVREQHKATELDKKGRKRKMEMKKEPKKNKGERRLLHKGTERNVHVKTRKIRRFTQEKTTCTCQKC